jgi:hypothetical protein
MSEDITTGIVVRNIKSKGAFDEEEVDIHGRLLDASVDAKQDDNNFASVTEHMDRGKYNQYATCDAKKIVQKGGRVRKVPLKNDPNHCEIFGITIKEANNLFSNHRDWPSE